MCALSELLTEGCYLGDEMWFAWILLLPFCPSVASELDRALDSGCLSLPVVGSLDGVPTFVCRGVERGRSSLM